jgi:hypothetical protein
MPLYIIIKEERKRRGGRKVWRTIIIITIIKIKE